MKKPLHIIITIMICFMTQLNIAQNLSAGDIAFIGFHQDNPDGFTFITLTDIPANEVIYFTDHSWSVAYNNWHNNTADAHFSWTAPSTGVSIGTIVTITETSTESILTATSGTISKATNFGSFSLISGGDVLFAYQSANGPMPTANNATFLAGIYTDDNYAHNTDCDGPQGWYNGTACASDYTTPGTISTGGNASGIAPGLTNGVNAVHLYPAPIFESSSENDNGRYTGTLTGNANDIRVLINDRTKWSFGDSSAYDTSETYFTSNTTVNITAAVPTCDAPSLSYITVNLYTNPFSECVIAGGVYAELGIVNGKKSYAQISSISSDFTGELILFYNGTQWIISTNDEESPITIATNTNTTSDSAPLTGWSTTEEICPGSNLEISNGAYIFDENTFEDISVYDFLFYAAETGGSPLTGDITTGTYYASITIGECESFRTAITLNTLTINNEITESNGVLTATETNASYQWFVCNEEGNSLIDNVSSQSYTPTATGSYSATIFKNGGYTESDCYEINTLHTVTVNDTPHIKVYPNPARTSVFITTPKATSFVILNLLGQTVTTFNTEANKTKTVDIKTLSNGIYLIKSLDANTSFTHKLSIKN